MDVLLSEANRLVLAVALATAISLGLLLFVFFRRRRSRQELLQRVAELEALSAAGRAIVAAELDIDALCKLIAEQAGQIIDNDTFQIGLFEGDFYEIRYWSIDGELQETPQRFDLTVVSGEAEPVDGLVGWMRQSHQTVLVRDFQRELSQLPAQPSYQSNDPPRSALFVPLVSGDRAIGVLAAQSRRPNRFNVQDTRRLTILANQATAAIANAYLYEQERMRAAHLSLVGQIARQVNALGDLDEVFEEVVRLTVETFGFHPVSIFRVDPESDTVFIEASSLLDDGSEGGPAGAITIDLATVRRASLPIGAGIVGTAAATRETIVANNTAEDARFLPELSEMSAALLADSRSEIAIPLVVNETLLGVLDVQSADVGAFGETEQVVLEALAAEVASAIYKAEQLARQQEQAWLSTAQLQVAEAIGRSDDLDETLIAITLLTPLLTGVNLCGVLLWRPESETYDGMVLADASGDIVVDFSDIHLRIGDWGALDAVHVGREALTTGQIPAWFAAIARSTGNPGIDCLRLYPLLASQGIVQGILLVDRSDAQACDDGLRPPGDVYDRDPSREELLQNIARQSAQAVDSANLRLAQQEEAWVNTALLQVAEAVNSLSDLNEILDTIVRLVPLLVGVDAVLILIWDELRQVFRPGPSHGVSTMGRGLVETLEITREEFMQMSPQLSAWFESPQPSSATYHQMRVPTWFETILNSPQAFDLPLVARGRLVGSMVVGTRLSANGRAPFSARRINILNGVAQQAATAVVNYQLYRESAERARLQQELDVAREIQTSFLPDGSPDVPGCSVATFWQAARQVGGDFYDFLPLGDDKWGVVIADVADKGVPAALFMALSRTILRTVAFSRADPAHALIRANEIIGREARSDLFVTVFYGVWDMANERFTYANAGHNPPLLMQPNGQFSSLPGHGMALGILPEIQMKSNSLRLRPGETILLYTDGVTEAINENYSEFGLDRLQMAARSAARKDAPAIVESITGSIRDHAGETPQFDDITLIVMKRYGASGRQ